MSPEIFGRASTMIAELDKQTPQGLVAAAKVGCEAMRSVKDLDLPKRMEKAFGNPEALAAGGRISEDYEEFLSFLRVERQVLQRAGAEYELSLFVLDTLMQSAGQIRERLGVFANDPENRAMAIRDLAEGIDRLTYRACETWSSLKSAEVTRDQIGASRKRLWKVARGLGWICLEAANTAVGASIAPPWAFVSLLAVAATREWVESD
jgi:hypothetical protein